ncbi:hypothetical protein [Vibrio mediterranei]|uniref:hypothetical protein n=1 Tax=Vibrio mediterranei TaxID=689 RepID=UPI0040691EB7
MFKYIASLTILVCGLAYASGYNFSDIRNSVRTHAPDRVTQTAKPGNGFTSNLGSSGFAAGIGDDVKNYIDQRIDEKTQDLGGGGGDFGTWKVTSSSTNSRSCSTYGNDQPVVHGDICVLGQTRFWKKGGGTENHPKCYSYSASCN